MAKKQGIYAVYSPNFKGIVHTSSEYDVQVRGKKKTFGKKCKSAHEANEWLLKCELNDGKIPKKVTKQAVPKTKVIYYAVSRPGFQQIYTSFNEYEANTKGHAHAKGKKFKNEQEAKNWLILQGNKQPVGIQQAQNSSKLLKEVVEVVEEVVIYIDGGFKDLLGKYGILAYHVRKDEPIFQNFGLVYDEQFNELKNVGAELMACLRALEWAFGNNIKIVYLVYDFEGIESLLSKNPTNHALILYQNTMNLFKRHMEIHFLHVRHGNREKHALAHKLTQLEL